MDNEHVILLPRAYYSAPITVFLASTPETVLGTLAANSEMAVEPPQAPSLGCFGGPRRDAWLQEVAILKDSLQGLDGTLFLEFNISRMGKRIDAVVVSGAVVFVIEFKVGEKHFTRADLFSGGAKRVNVPGTAGTVTGSAPGMAIMRHDANS